MFRHANLVEHPLRLADPSHLTCRPCCNADASSCGDEYTIAWQMGLGGVHGDDHGLLLEA